jgi:L-fuconolactonase
VSDHRAWLSLNREQALEPDLQICDPHHHLWNHPGSRYFVDEYLQDVAGDSGAGHRVIKSVFVECLQFYRQDGPEELRSLGETEFIDSVAGPYDLPHGKIEVAAGIVSFVDLAQGAAAQPILEAHQAASRRFRGVRHASAWDASDKIHNAHTKPDRNLLQCSEFKAGLSCLERMGLTFDAWLFHPQIPELTELAQAFPGLTIVLNHMAGPLGIGPYADQRNEVFTAWKSALSELAACDNVYVKLGGRSLTMAGFGWHKQETPPGSIELAEAMAPYYRTCIELFGADHCMFESNFPVDKASCSYTVLWNAFKRLTQDYSTAERAALFLETASRVYSLDRKPVS